MGTTIRHPERGTGGKVRFRFLFTILLALHGALNAQTIVRFEPILNGEPLVLSTNDDDSGGAAAGAKRVEVLRWYLSGPQLLRNGEVVFTPKKRHHLLDSENTETLDLQFNTPAGLNYDEIRFILGVDSLTAAGGAFGGDLDPTMGMYWTWRSGYINFKLEGTAPECPARKHRFQFHVGGFQGPFASQREVRLAVSPAEVIQVAVDLDRFFSSVNLKKQYQVMSPNEGSAELADLLAKVFRVRLRPSPCLHNNH